MSRAEFTGTLRYDGEGLIPAIVVEASTKDVLMLGYMNEAALQMTLETRYVTFYSRSRRRLWTKGETSGHTLRLQRLEVDCDRDSLLCHVEADGPTCHTGRKRCFDEEVER